MTGRDRKTTVLGVVWVCRKDSVVHLEPLRPHCGWIVKPKRNDCAHFYVTYDAHFRYGCRALDFKSQRLPMLEVQEASDQPCHFCQKKPDRA